MIVGKISIKNFGPVQNADIDLDKGFQIFIGAQASGKSTIGKTIYFCNKIKDYTLDFMTDSAQFTQNHENEYFVNYMKYLKKQFMGCFCKTTHMRQFMIKYEFGVNSISIQLNENGYVRFLYNSALRNAVCSLIYDAAGMNKQLLYDVDIDSIFGRVKARAVIKQELKERLSEIFEDNREIIYIPAGRSLLATMSEQLHDFSIADMDLTMQEFINLIGSTKSKFEVKIPDMVKEYTSTVKGQVNNVAIDQAYQLINRVLKADYASETDGEKIYFDSHHWLKLMYGSSGQQEALWILMLIFISILENRKCFMVIEEPEAHLFPKAQNDILKLISLFINITGSQVIVTTHSPYILTSANILLYADKVERRSDKSGKTIVPKNYRISFDKFAAYKVGASDNSVETIIDMDTHMIELDYIDEASTIINKDLDELMDLEIQNDM